MDTLTDDELNLIDQVDTDPIMQADESIYLPFTIQYVVICPIILVPEYLVPFKTGPVEYRHAINWAGLDGKVFYGGYEAIEKQFARHNKSIDDWSVKQKIDHTAAFARFVQTLPEDGITG
ncbi:hypothetical protein NBRC13296_05330 [Paenibacillus chitinolyticus]|uniref:hypothetical protein n=1 Tax=Paenibacillus chitinolyticus TaxID=79263 RepID=UPI0035567C33